MIERIEPMSVSENGSGTATEAEGNVTTFSTTVGSRGVHGDGPHWGFTVPGVGEGGLDEWFKPCGVYVIASGNADRPVKIGVSGDVARRILQFEAGNPHGLRCASYHPVSKGAARQVERRLHAMFREHALGREWFEIEASVAAEPIPELCRLGDLALEAHRQEILADEARREAAYQTQERSKRIREAIARGHAYKRFSILDARAKRS